MFCMLGLYAWPFEWPGHGHAHASHPKTPPHSNSPSGAWRGVSRLAVFWGGWLLWLGVFVFVWLGYLGGEGVYFLGFYGLSCVLGCLFSMFPLEQVEVCVCG